MTIVTNSLSRGSLPHRLIDSFRLSVNKNFTRNAPTTLSGMDRGERSNILLWVSVPYFYIFTWWISFPCGHASPILLLAEFPLCTFFDLSVQHSGSNAHHPTSRQLPFDRGLFSAPSFVLGSLFRFCHTRFLHALERMLFTTVFVL